MKWAISVWIVRQTKSTLPYTVGKRSGNICKLVVVPVVTDKVCIIALMDEDGIICKNSLMEWLKVVPHNLLLEHVKWEDVFSFQRLEYR